MFAEYAKIFQIVLANCNQVRDNELSGIRDLILPSNEDWRCRVYYKLVELQREFDADISNRIDEARLEPETEVEAEPNAERKKRDWEWEPKRQVYGLKVKSREHGNGESEEGSTIETRFHPGWRVRDILLAADVLRKVQPSPTYSDEAEMRRVFGLVYDVFRYKKIFTRALEDIGFWRHNAAIKDQERIVWLLLYDMQGRKFDRSQFKTSASEVREKLFKDAGLADIENSLLEVKTHLAASISRLRIRSSALNLDELLPTHLRVIGGIAWGEQATIASGWINTVKFTSKEEFLEEMSKLKMVYCESVTEMELGENEYTFDPICPKVVNLHENARELLAVSSLVHHHRFVFLERSLCLGAAALVQAIRASHLCGPVVLTHSLAPRHTGYLAGLLADIEHAGTLLAFGAGDRRCEYESYLKDLGITLQQCHIFSEKYASHLATNELERATVVLAMPSCSYTGVRDIVDLAIARGGDIDLLESLTNVYAETDDENERNHDNREQWQTFLDDQMSTLKYALTRPNVQFLIYEVHTMSPSETTEMIQKVVDCVNRMAVEKYSRELPRKGTKESSKSATVDVELQSYDQPFTLPSNVTIPNSDLFELGNIDDVYGENTSYMRDPRCFLAIIKRKEMMQFDSLFMIKVAESKGLFGNPRVQQLSKHESVSNRSPRRTTQASARKQPKRVKIEIDRIMAHTYSSLSRSTQENRICPRHERCASCGETTELQVSKSFKLDATISSFLISSSNTWQKQKKSANQRKAKHESRATRSMLIPRSKLSILQTEPKRKETWSVLTDYLNVEPLQRKDWSHAISSSTILTSPIVDRAARPIPLESINIEDYVETENKYIKVPSKMGHQYWTSSKTSRLLHPVGSPSNVLDSLFDVYGKSPSSRPSTNIRKNIYIFIYLCGT
ncbi:uncharacterized protein LOC143429264 [Xylocopa sonorina]|uniref:uncharacterized protein LOC143429264 n=1 Tax=Xylocopa sonorina TaxID=1818115 RepID=UPI00403AAB2E